MDEAGDTGSAEVPHIGRVRASWFTGIWSKNGLLGSEHIDALVNRMLISANNAPDRFKGKWSVIEQVGWTNISSKDCWNTMRRSLHYVMGKLPENRALPWDKVDRVYGIGHIIELSHWVCYELNLRAQEVTVYDSLYKSTGEATARVFENVIKNIPQVLQWSRKWPAIGVGEPLKEKWDLKMYENAPE